jgi:HK97 family phage major capsid protein
LVNPQYISQIWHNPNRPAVIRDLFNVATTDSNAIEFVQETGFNNIVSTLTVALVGGETTLTVANAVGFFIDQVITLVVDAPNPAQTFTVTAVDIDAGTIDIDAAVANPAAIGNNVTSDVFAPTPELREKPQMGLQYTLQSAPVRTIAHWIPASRQIMADAGQLADQINGRLMYGLQLAEEQQLLYGSGQNEQILGILANPDVPTYDQSVVPTDTKMDAVRRAMNVARLAEYMVDGVVLNPTDWTDIELLKGSDNHYIFLNISQGNSADARLFRIPVVDTTAINPGNFVTGSFGMGSTIFDREQSTIRTTDSHEEYFIKNQLAILAEERIALATYRPEAYVNGIFV